MPCQGAMDDPFNILPRAELPAPNVTIPESDTSNNTLSVHSCPAYETLYVRWPAPCPSPPATLTMGANADPVLTAQRPRSRTARTSSPLPPPLPDSRPPQRGPPPQPAAHSPRHHLSRRHVRVRLPSSRGELAGLVSLVWGVQSRRVGDHWVSKGCAEVLRGRAG
jgi:hypothetical protein